MTMEVSVTDLKKLAETIRTSLSNQELLDVADALDAYAKPASDAVREALELAHGRLHAKGFLQAAGVVFDLKYELLGEQP